MGHRPLAAGMACCALTSALVGACRDEPPVLPSAAVPPAIAGAPAEQLPSAEAAEGAELLPAPTSLDVKVVRSRAGVVVPVLEAGSGGWRVSTPCGREAFLADATPVREAVVVIDPGHGGWDPGAVGYNGLTEASLNLAVSAEAKAALEHAGVSVVLTRSDNHGMSLPNRATVAHGLGARVFVSVHHNAAAWARSSIPGSDVYYQEKSDDSKRLAGLLYEEIVRALSAYDVPWVSIDVPGVTFRTRARDGDDWYGMVRLPKPIPAALAELAYISNPREADLLARSDVQRVEGEALARGILRYLNSNDPGSGFVPGGQMGPRPRSGGGGGGEDPCDDPPL